jgi:hypothetical protein
MCVDGRDKRGHDVGEALGESGRRLAPSTNSYRNKRLAVPSGIRKIIYYFPFRETRSRVADGQSSPPTMLGARQKADRGRALARESEMKNRAKLLKTNNHEKGRNENMAKSLKTNNPAK